MSSEAVLFWLWKGLEELNMNSFLMFWDERWHLPVSHRVAAWEHMMKNWTFFCDYEQVVIAWKGALTALEQENAKLAEQMFDKSFQVPTEKPCLQFIHPWSCMVRQSFVPFLLQHKKYDKAMEVEQKAIQITSPVTNLQLEHQVELAEMYLRKHKGKKQSRCFLPLTRRSTSTKLPLWAKCTGFVVPWKVTGPSWQEVSQS